jgi:hypothetical protein
MERLDPKKGDPLIDRGRRTTIDGFSDDHGTKLYNGNWVYISEFEKGADGVWRRPEPHGLTGLVDLERPVDESGQSDLEEAALLLYGESDRLMRNPGTAALLSDVFKSLSRVGRMNLDLLNRVGGPETVRLARHIIRQAGLTDQGTSDRAGEV